MVDGIHHCRRAADGNGVVVQHRVFRIVNVILGTVASPLDDHGHLRHPAIVHIGENRAGILGAYRKGGSGHVAGIGNGIAQGDPLPGLGDLGKIHLGRQLAGIQLAQLTSDTGQVQRYGGIRQRRDHQVPLVQNGLALHYHRDIGKGIVLLNAHVLRHIQPQAHGNRQGQHHGIQLIFSHSPSPPLPCRRASSASGQGNCPPSAAGCCRTAPGAGACPGWTPPATA